MNAPPTLTVTEAERTLQQEVAASHRAVITAVIGPADALDAFDATVRSTPGLKALRIRDSEDCASELHAWNSARDLLLRESSAIVFLMQRRDDMAFLRRHANDLTSIFDLQLRIATPTPAPAPWPDAAPAVRQAMIERCETLDLTGLVPGTVDTLRLSLRDIFIDRDDPLWGARPGDATKPLLLIGEPGSGKTTQLRHTCLTLNTTPPAQHAAALFLPLSQWFAAHRERETPLREWIASTAGPAPLQLDAALPHLTLLLDGIDEVQGIATRRDVLQQAYELSESGARVVVAGRNHIVDDLRRQETERFSVRPIGDFKTEYGGALARNLCAQRHPRDTASQFRILEQVRSSERSFLSNPLLTTFLVVLADARGQLPESRAELYRDLVELLLYTRSKNGPRWRRAELLRVLAPLGWELVQRGVGGLRRDELVTVLQQLESKREADPKRAQQAAASRLDDLVSGTSLLRVDNGLYRFQHPTLAEFFAARSVLQHADHRAIVVDEPYVNVSPTVVQFAVALVCDLEPNPTVERELLDALKRRSSRRGRYDSKIPVLLGGLLKEVGSLSRSDREAFAEAMERNSKLPLAPDLAPLAAEALGLGDDT